MTRKRKKNFYKDLEVKNQELEAENQRLTQLLQEYKKKEIEWTLGRKDSILTGVDELAEFDDEISDLPDSKIKSYLQNYLKE